eukprot:XP_027302540.1 annexin A1 [Anas platyrhynchos]
MAMVSEFLKQAWFMDNQEQECIKSSKGGHSVQSYPNFDPSADVAALDKAITVKGVDEATIIDILTKRTNAQRQQIKAAYQQAKGKVYLQGVVVYPSRQLSTTQLFARSPLALYEAGERRKGTDINVFVTVLTARSYPHLRRGRLGETLFLTGIVFEYGLLLNSEIIYISKMGLGTRHKQLIRIMVSRHEVDMNEIKAYYKSLYGISLRQAIMDELKGDYENILVALCGSD